MTNTAFIIDDEKAGLDNLERLLGYCEGVEVVGKFLKPEKALQQIAKKKPDILFLDIDMPSMSGFEVMELFKLQTLNPIIIITSGNCQYAINAIKNQVFDYLLKPIVLDELKETIFRLCHQGFYKPIINNNLAKLLSPREVKILELITQGKTSKEIAVEFFISKTTVDTHRRNIIGKTNAKSTVGLITQMVRL